MIGIRNMRRLGAALALGLGALLALGTGTASAQVVISQIYSGGGNSGAPYKQKYVELFNAGSATVTLTGKSIQYAPAAGTNWSGKLDLTGSIAANGYFLVVVHTGSNGVDIPVTPDQDTGGFTPSATNGNLALVNTTTKLLCSTSACATDPAVLDLVGYGTGAAFEGSGAAPAPSNTSSLYRKGDGCTDTNDNAADFDKVNAPNFVPRYSGTPTHSCGVAATDPVFTFEAAAVSAAEGDASANTLSFSVAFAPVIAAGETVSFDIAVTGDAGRYNYAGPASVTLDDTATSPYVIEVQTVPNTITDGDASVTVTLSNFSGTDVSQVDPIDKVGTIIDDDIAFTKISAIQGSGQLSPLNGQAVTTRGIVTGITSNGRSYYLQSQPGDEDGDAATSEGLYVYGTAGFPAATGLAVGDLVYVSGTVSEYSPATGGLPITELTYTSTTLLSSGHALPTPITLTPAQLDPAGPIDLLEPLEYMRVTVQRFVVVAPTGSGAADELFGVLEGTARPFREPGVDLFRCGVNPAVPGSVALPAEAPANVPCQDNNPELLRVKSNLLAGGATLAPMRSGTVLENLTGVLDYAFGRYTILTRTAEPAQMDVGAAATGTPVSAPAATEVTIGGYNVENLALSGGVAYTRKADKIAQTIVAYLHTPDVLGLIEVADLATLDDIAARVTSIAANDPQYATVMLATSGTQRLGFLVKQALVGATPRVTVVGTPVEHGAGLHVLCPDGVSYTIGLLNDRPPLQIDVEIAGSNGVAWPVTIINNHLKSMINLDSTADADANYACFNDPLNPGGGEGRRNRAKRQQNAEFVAELVDSLQTGDPNRAIVLVGDYNAFEFNDGYADLMGTIKGEPSANDETVVPDDGVDLVDPDLVLLTELVDPAQRYSYTFGGNAQTIDQILVNEVVVAATVGIPRMEFGRVNADFHSADALDTGNAFGNSDHDPALAFLDIAAFRSADLTLALMPAAANAVVGDTLSYAFNLTNDGPDEAIEPRLVLTLPTGVLFASLTAAPGWTCTTPAVGQEGVIDCQIASLANAANASFEATVTLGWLAAGTTVSAPLSATTRSTDPVVPNAGSFTTVVAPLPDAIFSDGFED